MTIPISLKISRDFLSSVSGEQSNNPGTPLNTTELSYITDIVRRTEVFVDVVAPRVFTFNGKATTLRKTKVEFVIRLMTRVSDSVRTQDQPSIDSILEELITSRTVDEPIVRQFHNAYRQMIFFCIGLITALFTPIVERGQQQDNWFNIDTELSKSFLSSSLPISMAERPLVEIIQEMGPKLLPVKRNARQNQDSVDLAVAHLAQCFSVSHLNGDVLRNVGGITIHWVNSITAHLDFDVVHKRLSIFRLPSLCEVHRRQDSTTSQILNSLYDEYTKPAGFSTSALMQEIMLSTKLIFGDNKLARKMYEKHEKSRAKILGFRDPFLDELCGLHTSMSSSQPVVPDFFTESYDKEEFFPLLAPKLEALQKYMIRQHPNQWRALWADRRDLTRWYTFWAVAIFGSVGVFLSIVQCALGAAQVVLARQAL